MSDKIPVGNRYLVTRMGSRHVVEEMTDAVDGDVEGFVCTVTVQIPAGAEPISEGDDFELDGRKFVVQHAEPLRRGDRNLQTFTLVKRPA